MEDTANALAWATLLDEMSPTELDLLADVLTAARYGRRLGFTWTDRLARQLSTDQLLDVMLLIRGRLDQLAAA